MLEKTIYQSKSKTSARCTVLIQTRMANALCTTYPRRDLPIPKIFEAIQGQINFFTFYPLSLPKPHFTVKRGNSPQCYRKESGFYSTAHFANEILMQHMLGFYW